MRGGKKKKKKERKKEVEGTRKALFSIEIYLLAVGETCKAIF